MAVKPNGKTPKKKTAAKPKRKKVAENMSADYLEDRANMQYQKLKTMVRGSAEYNKLFKQWQNTKDKRYELYGRG